MCHYVSDSVTTPAGTRCFAELLLEKPFPFLLSPLPRSELRKPNSRQGPE